MPSNSHRSPRNVAGLTLEDESPANFQVDCEVQDVPSPGLLADAFSEFIAAAARLEGSYAELQGQVAHLSLELAERNAALNASLAENERMRLALQQIVDSMPCGVLVLERGGELSMINPEGMRLLGLGRGQVAGQPHREPTTEPQIQIPIQPQPGVGSLEDISHRAGIDLASLLADEEFLDGEQEICVAGPGGRRWIEVRNRRLYSGRQDAEGPSEDPSFKLNQTGSGRSQSSQTILILRDVTAHKQAEQERERARRATALAEVAAILAHEIRNPLASLELFAGLIADSESVGASNGGERQWIAHMRAGIRTLAATVNNVLSFHGAGFPALAPLELAKTLESSVEFVRPIADQAGVGLHFHAAGATEAGLQVLGNASGLQQVVLNLIANAVRHTPKGGEVRVGLRLLAKDADRLDGRRVEIAFADTGSGIREDQMQDIFRPGFSGSGNSSGLGLAVCVQIVRQHGGTMRVSSRLGAGTTFYVELPAL